MIVRCRWCKPYPLAVFVNQELIRVERRHTHRKCIELSGEDITAQFVKEVSDRAAERGMDTAGVFLGD